IFQEIVNLHTGEALVFCPTAVLDMSEPPSGPMRIKDLYQALGDSYFKIRIRKRISEDGGKSIMANDKLLNIPEITSSTSDRSSSLRTVTSEPEQSRGCSKSASEASRRQSALGAKSPDPNVLSQARSRGRNDPAVYKTMQKNSTQPSSHFEGDGDAISRA